MPSSIDSLSEYEDETYLLLHELSEFDNVSPKTSLIKSAEPKWITLSSTHPNHFRTELGRLCDYHGSVRPGSRSRS